jgi:hypothetical protein
MYNQESTSKLGYSLRIRQLRLGRRINYLALRDGLRDGRLTRSAINPQAPHQAPP